MDFFTLIGIGISVVFLFRVLIKGGFNGFDKLNKTPKPSPPRPDFYYHGTEKPIALEIWKTGLWQGGDSKPRGVYLGSNMKIAKEYCGDDAAIVVVKVGPRVKLKKKYEGAYYFPLPDEEPYEKYYQIPGLIPIGVISPDGKWIE